MNNINFEFYHKKVSVVLNTGEKIIGEFLEDFEDEQEILIGSTIIKYEDIKNMVLI